MNKNEEQFPEGTRVRISEEYGAWAKGDGDIGMAYREFHGLEGTVAHYADVNEPYIRVRLDNPPEEWPESALYLSDEIEAV